MTNYQDSMKKRHDKLFKIKISFDKTIWLASWALKQNVSLQNEEKYICTGVEAALRVFDLRTYPGRGSALYDSVEMVIDGTLWSGILWFII